MSDKEFYVEIVQYAEEGEDEKVVKRSGPHSERRADKIDDGLNINLNHERFYTRVVES
jgi:hypothetical protein